jgi:hypothetical protein
VTWNDDGDMSNVIVRGDNPAGDLMFFKAEGATAWQAICRAMLNTIRISIPFLLRLIPHVSAAPSSDAGGGRDPPNRLDSASIGQRQKRCRLVGRLHDIACLTDCGQASERRSWT